MDDKLNTPLLQPTVSPPLVAALSNVDEALTKSPRSITPPLVPLGNIKRQPYVPERSSDQFHRMKFYGALERRERESPAQPHYQSHWSSHSTEPGNRSPAYGSRTPGSPGSPGWGQSPRSFLPPSNIVPSYLYMIGANRGASNLRGRKPSEHDPPQSRMATITSLMNTMMGSTIMALPWGFFESGLVGGALIVTLACVCSFITAAMVLRRGSRDLDFQHLVRRTLGNNIATLSGFVNVLVMLGASVAYHILMKDCLHVIGTGIISWADTPSSVVPITPNASHVVPSYYMTSKGENILGTPGPSTDIINQHVSPAMAFWQKHQEYAALLVLVVFPLTTLKNLTTLVKFNSLGVFFLFFNIIFMVYQGVSSATHDHNEGWKKMMVGNYSSIDDVPFFGSNLWFKPLTFGALAGMSMLAFFVHNAIHPIMRHSNPKTRLCDLGIAYSMVGSLYIVVGFAGALVLPKFAPLCFPEIRSSNCQSFLAMFDPNEVFAFMANCALFMQLFTVFPILLVIIRSEVFGLAGFKRYPPQTMVVLCSFLCMCVTTSFAIWYPKVGEVLRFTGSGGGLIIVFIIPCLIDSIALCKRAETGPVDQHLEQRAGNGTRTRDVTPENDREIARINRSPRRSNASTNSYDLKEGLWQKNSVKRCLRLTLNIVLVMMAAGVLALQFIE